MTKRFCLLHFISQEPYFIWLSFMVHLCEIMISRCFFFKFFQNFDFLGCLVYKIAQNGPKEKTFCLLRYISQEPYIIRFSFMVHMCKMIVSAGIFFIFSKFWFFTFVSGVRVQKIAQNDNKLYLSRSISQKPYIIWSSFVIHKCKMKISPSITLISSKF